MRKGFFERLGRIIPDPQRSWRDPESFWWSTKETRQPVETNRLWSGHVDFLNPEPISSRAYPELDEILNAIIAKFVEYHLEDPTSHSSYNVVLELPKETVVVQAQKSHGGRVNILIHYNMPQATITRLRREKRVVVQFNK